MMDDVDMLMFPYLVIYPCVQTVPIVIYGFTYTLGLIYRDHSQLYYTNELVSMIVIVFQYRNQNYVYNTKIKAIFPLFIEWLK